MRPLLTGLLTRTFSISITILNMLSHMLTAFPLWWLLRCGGQLPIKGLATYITFMYFQPTSYPECFHLVKVLSIYITVLWFLGSDGYPDAHKCLLYLPGGSMVTYVSSCTYPKNKRYFLHSLNSQVFVFFNFYTHRVLCLCGSLVEAAGTY